MIYNPVLIFVLPIFAITCDWTEALLLLKSQESIDREKYKSKSNAIKKTFLWLSVTMVGVMWISILTEFLENYNFWQNLWSFKFNTVLICEKTISAVILLFAIGVTIQITYVYRNIYMVLKKVARLLEEHHKLLNQRANSL